MSDETPPGPGEYEDDEIAPVIAETTTGQPAPAADSSTVASARSDSSAVASAKAERPRLLLAREPLYRESRGYRMRLEPADLARLRELPGSKGLSDIELGDAFFDGQADRFTEALSEDVPAPADIRVVVDPYSRQAFLALENRIRAILSF